MSKRPPMPHYTQTPNVFFDEIMQQLQRSEILCYLYIVRHTLGFHRGAPYPISIDEFENGIRGRDGSRLDRGTGLTRSNICTALNELEDRGLIWRCRLKVGDAWQSTSYRLRFSGEEEHPDDTDSSNPAERTIPCPEPRTGGGPAQRTACNPAGRTTPAHRSLESDSFERNMKESGGGDGVHGSSRGENCAAEPAAAAASLDVSLGAEAAATAARSLGGTEEDVAVFRREFGALDPAFIAAWAKETARRPGIIKPIGYLRTALRSRDWPMTPTPPLGPEVRANQEVLRACRPISTLQPDPEFIAKLARENAEREAALYAAADERIARREQRRAAAAL